MNKELEELILDEEDLEIIEKISCTNSLDFPALCVGKQNIYFNKEAQKSGLIPKYVKWMTTSEYVIGLPCKREDKNAFVINVREKTNSITCHVPVKMAKEKCIRRGVYKMMKCKDGFAFKRYEQVST